MTKLNLDLRNVKENSGGGETLLPPGNYNAKIVDTEIVNTKSGSALKIHFEVIEGEHSGSGFSDFLNIVNASKQAEDIAKGRLKAILNLGGHKNPQGISDSIEMHGLILSAVLENRTNGEYTNNDVKGYKKYQYSGDTPSNGAAKNETASFMKSPSQEKESVDKMPWE
ncbi:MAG: hypothetical protein DRQ88_09220 [Epsilonproteobacteria bacterium]|nr:MAG: hypothetical protein DRQ88_09220 [Campylobacterota bacterium]